MPDEVREKPLRECGRTSNVDPSFAASIGLGKIEKLAAQCQ